MELDTLPWGVYFSIIFRNCRIASDQWWWSNPAQESLSGTLFFFFLAKIFKADLAWKILIRVRGCQLTNRGTDNYPRRGCTTDNKLFSPARLFGTWSQSSIKKKWAGGKGSIKNFLPEIACNFFLCENYLNILCIVIWHWVKFSV